MPRTQAERQQRRRNAGFYLWVIAATWAGTSLFFWVRDLVRGWE